MHVTLRPDVSPKVREGLSFSSMSIAKIHDNRPPPTQVPHDVRVLGLGDTSYLDSCSPKKQNRLSHTSSISTERDTQ
ncbi:hypothetical protein J6590_013871 [Homalodisca vitripennis]|nr:hypothetical protein J6590_013871 [Homalodisca vitripennis]